MCVRVCHAQGALSQTLVIFFCHSSPCFLRRRLSLKLKLASGYTGWPAGPMGLPVCLPVLALQMCSTAPNVCIAARDGTLALMSTCQAPLCPCAPCSVTSWHVWRWVRLSGRKMNEFRCQPWNSHMKCCQRRPFRMVMEPNDVKQSVLVWLECALWGESLEHIRSTLGTPQKNLTVISHLTRLLINPDFSVWQLSKQRWIPKGFVAIQWYNQCKCIF